MSERSSDDGVPRLALNQRDAAKALGMSVNSFKEHVRPFIRSVWVGRMRLYPVAELEKWLDRKAQGL